MRALLMVAGLIAGLGFAPADAQEFGTAEQAQSMLKAAVEAVRRDKDAALAAFTAGEAPFKEKDLYVFCSKDGVLTAHGADSTLVGQNAMEWKDKRGKAFIQEMNAVAAEDTFKIVEYMWPRPGETEPTQKASYVTRVDDQICGVGYYK